MKYEFIKLAEDTYKLKYKEKELEFKSNIKMVSEVQGLMAQARIRMIQDYAKTGHSVKELTIEEKKNGKTFYDNSNKIALEEVYREQLTVEYMNKKCEELFQMDLGELMQDIGLTEEKESEEFVVELSRYMSGNTPSK